MRAALTLIALALLTGCATSELTVRVDLYDEDPRFVAPMTPEQVAEQVANLERLRAAAQDKTSQRRYLAEASVQMYNDTRAPLFNSPVRYTTELDDYRKAADSAQTDLGKVIDTAITALEKYATDYQTAYESARRDFQRCENERLGGQSKAFVDAPAADAKVESLVPVGERPLASQCWLSEKSKFVERLDDEWVVRRLPIELRAEEAKARGAVAKAAAGYASFAAPVRNSFVVDWAGLRADLYDALEHSSTDAERLSGARRAVHGLNVRLASLAEAANLVPKSEIAEAVESDARGSATGLSRSTMKIAIELESLRGALPEDASAQTALSGLVRSSSRFAELIDRLQDAGDPVWRTVTNPANDAHWNTMITESGFFAQGKSNVVIVRQDAMRYDIHEGTNDPAALVRAQLEISRAVANAAINVAGAATGIKVPGGGTKPGDPAADDAAAATSDANKAEAFAKRKAKAEEEERARQTAMRGLSMELNNILLNIAGGGDAVLASQRARLMSLLKAYRDLLDISAD